MEMMKKITVENPENPLKNKVYGITGCMVALVKFRNDRDGKDEVKMAFIVPGGEVYFLPSRGFEQASKWLKDSILKKLGESDYDGSAIDLTKSTKA